jgi:acyl-coenzyme A synthetase/AMP-(fatty) acid ligase
VNALFSTETGPIAANAITRDTVIDGDDLPVGYPLPDKEILVVDEAGSAVGVGEIGEIAVRSRYLCRGYCRRPDLTRAKFRSDPGHGPARTYLTGDLGLLLPDGRLVHKGRKDFRVKIRGYGVDIVEVENAVRAHPDVTDAAVVASAAESGEPRLVAFFASGGRPAPGVGALRAFLNERLASHMVPSASSRSSRCPSRRAARSIEMRCASPIVRGLRRRARTARRRRRPKRRWPRSSARRSAFIRSALMTTSSIWAAIRWRRRRSSPR